MEVINPSLPTFGSNATVAGVNRSSKTTVNGTILTKEVPVEDQLIETLDDLFLSKCRHHPDTPFISYPATAKSGKDYVDYTLGKLDQFIEEAARRYAAQGLIPKDATSSEAEVVALLAPSSLDYIIAMFALSRMGFAVLFLSTRLSANAYINLLKQTNCATLVKGRQFAKAADEVNSLYELSLYDIVLEPAYKDVQPGQARYPVARYTDPANRLVFIVHSSGSTGLPKPIFMTHSACLSNYASGIPYRAFLTLPLFHNHGIATMFRALVAGRKIAVYNSNLPLSGTTLCDAMEAVQPDSLHCVPYALKLMAETDRGMEALKRCKLVLFGGSACPDDLGDKLVDAGVYLVGHYGATEMGQLMTSYREPGDKGWNWMRPLASAKPYLRFEPIGNDNYEVVVLDGLPSKVLSNSDDPPNSYHTRDTFIKHPTMPDAWKYLGRLDDRVTLFNGEKVLPVPYEGRIRQDELVQEVIVFGVGRALPGMMIVPSDKAKGLSKKQILKRLMPTIDAANSNVEGFGRIYPEMIEILDVGSTYPRTDKGTVIRAAFYKQYEELIDKIYQRFENPAAEETEEKKTLDEDDEGEEQPRPRVKLTEEQLVPYLLDLFRNKIGISSLTDGTDFFDAGVDSLQAITARAYIMREVDLGGRSLAQNVVFEYPNVETLAKHISSLSHGETLNKEKDEVAVMRQLIDRYSDFYPRKTGTVTTNGESVVLTGATGSLGAHALGQLVKQPNVKKVWCLVRAASPLAAHLRVLSTLSTKGITDLSSHQLSKIMSLPADLSQPSLGLTEEVIAEMKDSLTVVLHSAWAVNFNLGVRSFESHHIRGTYNLLNFCLATKTVEPARLYFLSSISAGAGTPIPGTVPETYIDNLEHAQSMGYARSKNVTEHIVKAAGIKTSMVARVLRLGQIVGDTGNGMWNTTEAIPLMIQSAKTLGALPALDETPSWMPVDLMARSCLELAGLVPQSSPTTPSPNEEASQVYQVQNRTLFHWTRDLLPALKRAGLDFKVVSQREWVTLLRESNPEPVKNPTFKLLDFFAAKYDNDNPGRQGLVFETERTAEASQAVRDGYDVIWSGLIGKTVEWWKTQW